MGLVQLFNVDFACSANFFFVAHHRAVAEGVRRVLNVRQSLLSSLPAVEVHCECASALALFSVHLALEVAQELFELVYRVASCHIRNVKRSFKDRGHVALSLDFFNALGDHTSDFRAHNLRNFAAIFPEDIRDSLLAGLAIDTHVKLKVLVDQHRE